MDSQGRRRKVDANDRSRARGQVDRGWKRKFLFRKLPRHYPNHRGQRGQGGNVHNEARSLVDKDEAKEKLERETRTLVEELSRISRR